MCRALWLRSFAIAIAMLFGCWQMARASDDCTDDTWTPTSLANAPPGRWYHTAVWTGTEMIVWGGVNDPNGFLNGGGRYLPTGETWTAISTSNAPSARYRHTAIWTGDQMIVWGGASDSTYFNTGGKYNPVTDTWTITSIPSLDGRQDHTAIWTGSEMIVWGGAGNSGPLNTGGRYNWSTDSWLATSSTNAPQERYGHTAVWTGTEMIIWGGYSVGFVLNTGAKYNPNTNTWIATSIANAPAARAFHTAVWTGSEMIIWGGWGGSSVGDLNTGAKYNPTTDAWTPISVSNAPSARAYHTGVWTGSEMIAWGGTLSTGGRFNSGGRYSPATNTWYATATDNAPDARYVHTAVWTDNQMLVWGGLSAVGGSNSGGKYCAQPWRIQTAVSRKTHGIAGTFDVDLPVSGTPGVECRSGGMTNDYVLVITFSRNVTVNGNPQAAVTLGTGTVGSDGKPNGGMVVVSGNTVTVPLTNVTTGQTINVTLFGVNGVSNAVIPMTILVGDVNGNGVVNASDIALTKSRIGQQLNQTNFRADVTAGGSINAADVALVKSQLGHGLAVIRPVP